MSAAAAATAIAPQSYPQQTFATTTATASTPTQSRSTPIDHAQPLRTQILDLAFKLHFQVPKLYPTESEQLTPNRFKTLATFLADTRVKNFNAQVDRLAQRLFNYSQIFRNYRVNENHELYYNSFDPDLVAPVDSNASSAADPNATASNPVWEKAPLKEETLLKVVRTALEKHLTFTQEGFSTQFKYSEGNHLFLTKIDSEEVAIIDYAGKAPIMRMDGNRATPAQGSFATVDKVFYITLGKFVAYKQAKKDKNSELLQEIKMLRIVGGKPGCQKMFHATFFHNNLLAYAGPIYRCDLYAASPEKNFTPLQRLLQFKTFFLNAAQQLVDFNIRNLDVRSENVLTFRDVLHLCDWGAARVKISEKEIESDPNLQSESHKDVLTMTGLSLFYEKEVKAIKEAIRDKKVKEFYRLCDFADCLGFGVCAFDYLSRGNGNAFEMNDAGNRFVGKTFNQRALKQYGYSERLIRLIYDMVRRLHLHSQEPSRITLREAMARWEKIDETDVTPIRKPPDAAALLAAATAAAIQAAARACPTPSEAAAREQEVKTMAASQSAANLATSTNRAAQTLAASASQSALQFAALAASQSGQQGQGSPERSPKTGAERLILPKIQSAAPRVPTPDKSDKRG